MTPQFEEKHSKLPALEHATHALRDAREYSAGVKRLSREWEAVANLIRRGGPRGTIVREFIMCLELGAVGASRAMAFTLPHIRALQLLVECCRDTPEFRAALETALASLTGEFETLVAAAAAEATAEKLAVLALAEIYR